MIRFPSIEQYRNVIKAVQNRARWVGNDMNGDPVFNRNAPIPTLKFRGTVKLHGTNAGIVRDYKNGTITFQSRERELTLTSDNAGFAVWANSKLDVINDVIDGTVTQNHPNWQDTPTHVAVFGEWCGGNIQRGIALNGLDKMFVIFAVKFIYGEGENTTTRWINLEEVKHIFSAEDKIYNILNFQTYEIEIDFNKPHEAQNKMIEITNAVEAECPVGKAFGNEGVGEGVVWMCISEGWLSSDFWFKVKGEKHSASKVKTLAAVDVEEVRAVEDFVEMVVTEARLEQGIQNLVNEQMKPFEMTSMGAFIRWVHGDIMKEESDTIVANQIDPKKLGDPIAN
jgi:hypothetical protein